MPLHPTDTTSAAAAPRCIRWPSLEATGVVDAVVTTRHGGVSTGPYESLNLGLHVGDDPDAVIENRRRAAAAVGLGLDDLVFGRQVHGSRITRVGVGDRGRGTRSDDDAVADTDALITTESGVGLVVMVADCVPIVLCDPDAHVLACVHAGWRGTVAGIASTAVEAMENLGADPSRIVAWLGPAISPERYEVGDDVADAATAALGDAATSALHDDGSGRWRFDLWSANRHLLEVSGLDPDHIGSSDTDTWSGPYFSDRAVRPCGRFAAIARLRP